VYLGVEDLSDPAQPAAGSVRSAGVIGRIAAGKGQLVFLQAARMLEAELPHVRFLICGAPLFSDPEAKHYLDRVRRAAVGAHVEFRGWQDDVRETLSRLDLLVVPSLGDECTPRIILEAFSAGVPVVAFPSGGIPEIVRQDETGFLVEPRTAEALAACLRDLLVNRWDGVQQVAARARRAWLERFTLAHFQTRILEAMEELQKCGPLEGPKT
jgi:glycosyltransferase involved in cell wall biosynthesis